MAEGIAGAAELLFKSIIELKRAMGKGRPIGGLTPALGMLMGEIMAESAGGESPVELAKLKRRIPVSAPTLSQQLSKLEAVGYLRRFTDTSNRRAVLIELTGDGRAAMRQAKLAMLKAFEGLAGRLGEDRVRLLAGMLSEAAGYFSETNHFRRNDG
jgi:DNA-binding MarR family transcriptional regulator